MLLYKVLISSSSIVLLVLFPLVLISRLFDQLSKPSNIDILRLRHMLELGIMNATNTTTNTTNLVVVEMATRTDNNTGLPILNYTGQCRLYDRKCKICEGDCESDDDCDEGLSCFIRDSKTPSERIPVPGCKTNPKQLFAKDFCYNTTLAPCEDYLIHFIDSDSIQRNCSWVSVTQYRDFRCSRYSHFCRETCGHCRIKRRRNQNRTIYISRSNRLG